MVKGRLFITLFFLLSSGPILAQQFGGLLPSIRWNQANNDTVRIIFPSAMPMQARQVASVVSALGTRTLSTIGTKTRKVDIIFQNQTTVSNGYVQLAPFRSEFQMTADQNSFELGSLPWPVQLAIHEYRHVQQYNNFRVGLSGLLYILFGESGQELGNSLAIPNWFWEGDAVYQETLVSDQGRGRLPFFFNGYRSLWAANKQYSWMKLRNGSLRDYIPDHYPLGYMLVAYGREKYGDTAWKQLAGQAAAFRGLFYPWQHALRKNFGVSYDSFRSDALHYFREQEPSLSGNLPDRFAQTQKHFAGDEEFPQFLDPEHVIFVRSTYKRIHRFVIRDLRNGRETSIRTHAISLDNYFSCRRGYVAYAAYETNLRWSWSDYSVLRVLNIKTGREKRISSASKYFSPDISPDAGKLVAVEQDPGGTISLVLLNAETGDLLQRIPNPGHLYFTYPKFLTDSQLVAPIRNTVGEMALGMIRIADGSIQWLTPFSMNVVGFPAVRQDTVYFNASHQGSDRLFALCKTGRFQVQLPRAMGNDRNYQLQSAGGNFAWSRFTAAGYRMNVTERSAVHFLPLPADSLSIPLTEMNIRSLQQAPAGLVNGVSTGTGPLTPYAQVAHLFNIHSWRPYISDPEYTFALESENVLNTFQSELYFTYNRNEGSKKAGFNALYGALFPWIDAGVSYTWDRNGIFQDREIFWNEWQARAGLSVPITLTRGRMFTQWQVGGDVVFDQPLLSEKSAAFKDSILTRGFVYINPSVLFTNQTEKARQQINPSWAQSVLLQYETAIEQYQAWQFLASGYFYFPGLSATNSLVLTAAFQERDSLNEIRYSNNFPFSRGYTAENFFRMARLGANYHVPLVYPDWGFGNILYFLRVRANLFFDYTRVLNDFVPGTPQAGIYRSGGVELYFDTKWWNQLPLSFGIRYSHLFDPDFLGRAPNQWEFILPLTLLSK